jgi:hypothetical protein
VIDRFRLVGCETRPVRVGSFRWWFEDRATGRIVIAQFPNWPLFAIGGLWVVRSLVDPGTNVHDATRIASTALWIWWAGDELFRGVNPWRRALGVAVLAWQLVGLLA